MKPMRPESTWSSTLGFAVGDADVLLLATAWPAQLGAGALQGALGADHSLVGQQGVDLDHRQALVFEPAGICS